MTGADSAAAGRRTRGDAFRYWRCSRPFWGGLLMILAGLELLAIPLLSVLQHAIRIVIYIGTGGWAGVLIGGLLITCGLLAWLHPLQRVFYAITGGLLALASFPATNLGGFFAGMLLGVVGASLVFAWTPEGEQSPGGARGEQPGRPLWGTRPRGRRLLALPVVPLLVVPLTAGRSAPAAAGCLLPLLCPSPSPSARPSATPTGPAAPGLLAPGGRAPSHHKPANPNAGKKATASADLVAASARAVLTAGSARMTGLRYDGVATVPTATGSQRMLKFSMRSLTLSGSPTLTQAQGGRSVVTRDSSVSFTGNVVLYATRMCGTLVAVPVCFTPSRPPPAVLPVMEFTHVRTDQPLTIADSLAAPGLDITSG